MPIYPTSDGTTFSSPKGVWPTSNGTTWPAPKGIWVYHEGQWKPASVQQPVITNVASPLDVKRVSVTWAHNGVQTAGFRIYRDGVLRGTVGSGVRTFNDDDAALVRVTTYTYTVEAYGPCGAITSIGVNHTTPDQPAGVPEITGVTPISQSRIDITVTRNYTSNHVGFKVIRQSPSGTLYVNNTNGGTASDTGLSPLTQYCYRACGYNAWGDGGSTPYTCALTPLDPPVAPTITSITSTYTTKQVVVNWSHNAVNTACYNVYRNDVLKGSMIDASLRTWTDTDAALAANTSYTYKVEASGAGGTASASLAHTTPNVPTGSAVVTPTPISPTQINVTVGKGTLANNTLIRLARVSPAAVWELGATGGTVNDTGRTELTQYCYQARGENAWGIGAYSAQQCATTPATPPATPTITSITSTYLVKQVVINWSSTEVLTDSFSIYRNGVLLQSGLSKTARTWTDTSASLAPNTTYTYKVEAVRVGATSYDEEQHTTSAVPSGIPTVTVTAKNYDWVEIVVAAGTLTNYMGIELECVTTSDTWSLSAGTVNHTSLAELTQYCYRARGHNAWGNAASYCAQQCATTPAAPSNPLVTNAYISWRDAAPYYYATCHYTVSDAVHSVQVSYSLNGGSYVVLGTYDVTPGGSGSSAEATRARIDDTIRFRVIPYPGSGGSGTPGTTYYTNAESPIA